MGSTLSAKIFPGPKIRFVDLENNLNLFKSCVSKFGTDPFILAVCLKSLCGSMRLELKWVIRRYSYLNKTFEKHIQGWFFGPPHLKFISVCRVSRKLSARPGSLPILALRILGGAVRPGSVLKIK